jgi:hypothetical protein
MEPFSISLAPSRLVQAINPWTRNFDGAQFGLFNIDLGQSRDPGVERQVLDEVGSYGRQLGRIGDALEVVLKHVELGKLSRDETETLALLKAQLIEIDRIKRNRQARPLSAA